MIRDEKITAERAMEWAARVKRGEFATDVSRDIFPDMRPKDVRDFLDLALGEKFRRLVLRAGGRARRKTNGAVNLDSPGRGQDEYLARLKALSNGRHFGANSP